MIFLIALAVAAPPSEGPPTPPDASAHQGASDSADPPVVTPDPLTILMDFELGERDVVESAAKTRTTIQEAPAIITVVTQREIRDRGYRTLSDVLQNIPGFEGGRWEFNGQIKDNLTRGLPHTTLILLDGVNIVEPAQNLVVMDRKFPLDIVKRIEVISGPGGVLWGSNALLGVINIITHDGSSKPGFEIAVGGGHGPGEQGAARAHASYGGTFADDLVKLYISGTYFTTDGPSLELDGQKVIGPFPAPSPDAYSIYATGAATTEPVLRDHYLNISGNLEVGPVTLGWFTGYEVEHREISSGGVALTESYYDTPLATTDAVNNLVTAGSDQFHSLYLRYADRFDNQKLGVHAQAYMVHWEVNEDRSGVFARSDLLPLGLTTIIDSDGVWRGGVNVDFDALLPANNHLLIGAELFGDLNSDVSLTSFWPFPSGDVCPEGFTHRPDLDASRPCSSEEVALVGAQRVIGALYASDEWRVNSAFAINAGVRGQFSSSYDPAVLFSGGLVARLWKGLFLKASYSEGFRPPDFQSTSETGPITSAVSLETNAGLNVERSQATEIEVNARLFENQGVIRQLYLRTSYSYTRMEGVITRPQGRFENAGDRDIHSVELLGKLHFKGDHELWLGYHFVDVIDSEIGRLRNIANHVLNIGGRASFFDGHLVLGSVFTVRGSMEDLNRTPTIAAPGSQTSISGTVSVAPTGLEVTEIPTTALLRFGVEGRNLWDRWDIGVWVYNALDTHYSDPDLFFDDRIVSRPQPKPRVSFFVESRIRW